ncbi:MAG TPA: avidin/streptavidin family protein [Candidatus Binatia bacterium]|nr:avidin/streptavidin family protein [Candidatus Binatia bacterium]
MRGRAPSLLALSLTAGVAWAVPPTCQSPVGRWQNQLGSTLEIASVDPTTGAVAGRYSTAAGPSGWYALAGWINTQAVDPQKPDHVEQVVSWTVRWDQSGSVTSWTGYCTRDPVTGLGTITAPWHHSRTNSDAPWDHVVTNRDTFTAAEAATCCGATRIETTSRPGTMELATLPPWPFPANVQIAMEVGPPDGDCKHTGVVPAGGFAVPTFCIPALAFSYDIVPRGCAGGGGHGAAAVWDGESTYPDPDVTTVADTTDPDANSCGTLAGGCTTAAGNAGADTAGNIDKRRGGAPHPRGGLHARIDVPVRSLIWVDYDGECPDADGVFDPVTDTMVAYFDAILSPTTGHTTATFSDLNADGCAKAGIGPNAKSADGAQATGPCCTVGQTMTLAATNAAFTGGAPLFDITFKTVIPTDVTGCGPPVSSDTCTLATNPCVD